MLFIVIENHGTILFLSVTIKNIKSKNKFYIFSIIYLLLISYHLFTTFSAKPKKFLIFIFSPESKIIVPVNKPKT